MYKKGDKTMYSRASQRSKFTAPFVSPTMKNSMKPSTQQRQLGRDEKTQNDIIGVTHECYQGLKPKSPRRKLYTFKGPLDTLEVLQSGVGSSREKRYLIPPDQNKKTKYQPEVYEDVTNPVDITSTCRPSAVGHVHQAFNGRSPNKQDSHRKSAYNERKVKLDVLCSILKMKNELQIIHERREKIQDKIRHDHRGEE